MIMNVENMQKFGKAQIDAVTASSAAMTKGMQDISTETTSFSKAFFELSSSAARELLGVKSVDKAMEIQMTFVKQAHEGLAAQTTKVIKMYKGMAHDVAKPFQENLTGRIGEATSTTTPVVLGDSEGSTTVDQTTLPAAS